jgi:hypothetical protein
MILGVDGNRLCEFITEDKVRTNTREAEQRLTYMESWKRFSWKALFPSALRASAIVMSTGRSSLSVENENWVVTEVWQCLGVRVRAL